MRFVSDCIVTLNKKKGQIAHIDQDNTNSEFENLVFLCFEHHDEYDSKTSQSKGFTAGELKLFRNELDEYVKTELKLAWPDYPEIEGVFKDSERSLLSPEVYHHRIQVYRTVRTFLCVIFTDATTTVEQLGQFSRDTDEVIFLFDRDLAEYLRVLYKKAVRLRYTNQRLEDRGLPVGEETSDLSEENAELPTWFYDQFEIAREKFYKHIAL